jgi:hypothetical protein
MTMKQDGILDIQLKAIDAADGRRWDEASRMFEIAAKDYAKELRRHQRAGQETSWLDGMTKIADGQRLLAESARYV